MRMCHESFGQHLIHPFLQVEIPCPRHYQQVLISKEFKSFVFQAVSKLYECIAHP